MRRRGKGPRLSFFAFQDIITAVTGIVLVIVLMLALELQPDSPLSDAAEKARGEALAEAVESAERMEDDVERLESEAGAAGVELQRAGETSVEEIRRLQEDARRRLAEVQARRRTLAGQLSEAAAEAERAAAESEARAGDRERLEETRGEAERLAADAEEVKSDDRPIFVFPGGKAAQGYVVEVSAAGVRVARSGVSKPPRVFGVDGGGREAFLSWAGSNRGSYLILIGKPSAADEFEELRGTLAAGSRPFGYELAAEADVIIDAERGVGR